MKRLLTLGLLLAIALLFSGDPVGHLRNSSGFAAMLKDLSAGVVQSPRADVQQESRASLLTGVPGQNVFSMAIPTQEPGRFLLIGGGILGLVLIRRLLS